MRHGTGDHATPLIEIENLCRNYGQLRAVQEVSFQLQRGEVLGFLGPNGAGKSTTMRMLSGGLAPTAGTIRLNGIDLLEQPTQAKRVLGYLPEQPPLYPELTVDEYLRFCARLHRIPKSGIAPATARAKERCGLEASGNRLIANLSKGYRQRLGIAQAILHQPEVVILDEPTSGLDPNQIQEIRTLIRGLGEEHGVLLSTHILPEVEMVCDRVLILHQGRVVFSDSLSETQKEAEHTVRITLATPPAPEALAALNGVAGAEPMGGGRFRILLTAHGTPETLAEQLVTGGWGLRELTPERRDLEQIFTRLTAQEIH